MTDDMERRMDARIARVLRMIHDHPTTVNRFRDVADALDSPEPALKPCWSCGGHPIKAHGTCTFVMCGDETCGGNGYWKPVEKWNRRAEVPHG